MRHVLMDNSIEKGFIQNLKKISVLTRNIYCYKLLYSGYFMKRYYFSGFYPEMWLRNRDHMLNILPKILLIFVIFVFPIYLMTILVSWNLNALFIIQKWICNFIIWPSFTYKTEELRLLFANYQGLVCLVCEKWISLF